MRRRFPEATTSGQAPQLPEEGLVRCNQLLCFILLTRFSQRAATISHNRTFDLVLGFLSTLLNSRSGTGPRSPSPRTKKTYRCPQRADPLAWVGATYSRPQRPATFSRTRTSVLIVAFGSLLLRPHRGTTARSLGLPRGDPNSLTKTEQRLDDALTKGSAPNWNETHLARCRSEATHHSATRWPPGDYHRAFCVNFFSRKHN